MNASRRALGLGALLTLAGCSYSSHRLVSARGVSSIAVLQFDNKTYRRDLEVRVTRAVAEEIRARTSWRLESPSAADVILKGSIHSADTGVLAEASDRTPIAERFRVVADIELIERATGKVLRKFVTAERQEYTPQRFGETLEGSTTDVIAMSLAEDVVQGLEKPVGADDTIPPPNAPRRDLPKR